MFRRDAARPRLGRDGRERRASGGACARGRRAARARGRRTDACGGAPRRARELFDARRGAGGGGANPRPRYLFPPSRRKAGPGGLFGARAGALRHPLGQRGTVRGPERRRARLDQSKRGKARSGRRRGFANRQCNGSADRTQRRSNPAPIDPRSIGEGQRGRGSEVHRRRADRKGEEGEIESEGDPGEAGVQIASRNRRFLSRDEPSRTHHRRRAACLPQETLEIVRARARPGVRPRARWRRVTRGAPRWTRSRARRARSPATPRARTRTPDSRPRRPRRASSPPRPPSSVPTRRRVILLIHPPPSLGALVTITTSRRGRTSSAAPARGDGIGVAIPHSSSPTRFLRFARSAPPPRFSWPRATTTSSAYRSARPRRI